jgi:Mor family transcriptional regulator
MRDERVVMTEMLATQEGVEAAGIIIAATLCEDVLFDVLDHTPEAMKRVFFERFLSGMAGVICAHLGAKGAQEALDAVKAAIADAARSRAN